MQDLIGIICSEDLSKAYCIENSEYHKREIKGQEIEKETKVVYIPKNAISYIVLNSFNKEGKFEWNIDLIMEYYNKSKHF